VQSTIHIKSYKITFLVFSVQIKNVSKHIQNRVWHVDFRMAQFINFSIKVWYAQFIQHSSNAVMFAVN